MADLQLALQNKLKVEEDREANKKNLLTMELQPLETGLIDMSSDKIRSLTDYAVKKTTQKAVDLIKQKTGMDLLAKKQQLTEYGKNFVDSMNNHANDMMETANDKITDTLSNGRDAINNQLNRFHNMNNPFHSVNLEEMELPQDLSNTISIQPKSMSNAGSIVAQAQSQVQGGLSQVQGIASQVQNEVASGLETEVESGLENSLRSKL